MQCHVSLFNVPTLRSPARGTVEAGGERVPRGVQRRLRASGTALVQARRKKNTP